MIRFFVYLVTKQKILPKGGYYGKAKQLHPTGKGRLRARH